MYHPKMVTCHLFNDTKIENLKTIQ